MKSVFGYFLQLNASNFLGVRETLPVNALKAMTFLAY
jgi:hypothetical protein